MTEEEYKATFAWLVHTVRAWRGTGWDGVEPCEKIGWHFTVDAVTACRSLGARDAYGVDYMPVEGDEAATDAAVKAAILAHLAGSNAGYRPDPAGMTIEVSRGAETSAS
jgi:hypothetical protein